MTIKKIIDMATARIYEQSSGISQQEIERIIKKVIMLIFEELDPGGEIFIFVEGELLDV